MKRKVFTSEGVFFEYKLANIFSRAYAFLIDQLLIVSILSVLLGLLSLFRIFSEQTYYVISALSIFVVQQGYYIYFEFNWRGQTPGKRTLGIRVAHKDGLELELNQIVLRNLIRVVDGLPFMGALGGIICFFSTNNQRLGDLAGATIVLDIKNQHFLPIDEVAPNKFNSFLKSPHLCAKARKLILPDEVKFLFELLRRKEIIEIKERIHLYQDSMNYFQKKIGFPDNDIQNMPAEQYLKNLLEVLLKKKRATDGS